MHSLNLFSLAHAFIAAPLIIPRGAHESERKCIAVMKANVASKAIPSRVARVPSDAEYTYYNLFNSFSASLTKPELKDLLNDPNVDFIEKVSTMHGNFIDNADLDANGHGTHIAGTFGSKTYGVAKKTQLFAVKVLNEYTAGQSSGILAGMDFIVEDAATRKCSKGIVVNMSFSVAPSPAINAAARYIVKSGYFLAVAAGNDDTDASQVSPSNEPMACTVGATAENDTRASFSNYGVLVDIFAPGIVIKSTWIRGGVKLESGTSMATPHVTGLAAYLLGLKNIKASELCNLIATMSLEDVIKGIPENTVNLLIQNSEAK
ncbi:Uncharacterized protein LW93_14447 [Fusarium fujikuroi]|nr:Uncharacterized protein LW93_14447 [Fusarium fujikuroi]